MAGTEELRYVFLDALSGSIIEEIPLQGVNLNQTVEGGDFQGSFGLDQTGLDNEQLVSATIPGRCMVVVETDTRVYWGGLITSRTYQSQAKSVQLYAKTLDQYPSKRMVNYDRTFTATDPRNIMRQLYFDMQFDPNSITVNLPSEFVTANPIDFSVMVSEQKTYRAVIDQLATSTSGGFEWTIDWNRTENSYDKTLRIGQPLGESLAGDNVVFEYPGNILNYWRNDTIANGGTNVFGVGSGEGESQLIVEVVHADLISNGFPRLDTQITFKDVIDIGVLTGLTETQAILAKAPQPVYTVQMKADREPAFGDYGLGDYCRLVIKDPLHPGAGTSYSTRLLGWTYTPASGSNTSEVQLILQGDENDG
jgi:hypothetical protein